jgi:hypothetical protein
VTKKATSTKKVKLVIFPGEMVQTVTVPDDTGKPVQAHVTMGSIYVVNGGDEAYDMTGGPPPGKGYHDRGGHTAGVTPHGHYVLDKAEHHISRGWPKSVIPWGAKLREEGGQIQYEVAGRWHTATGRNGEVTKAAQAFLHRSGQNLSLDQVDRDAVRPLFYQKDGTLLPMWNKNDFGNWSWNMKENGERSAYYIHTTPENEAESAGGDPVILMSSHGCIHIRPVDRDDMMGKGYLKEGIAVEVRKYGQVGPP